MKVLVFAHSGSRGGAETALRHLVRILSGRHQVQIVLPNVEGSEASYYKSLGFTCYHLPMPWALPHFSSAALKYAYTDFREIAKIFQKTAFDIVISNTIAILHGGLIAHYLGIPCLTYAHEFLEDHELLPTSLSRNQYIDIVEDISTRVISCSSFVAGQFSKEKRAELPVLEPYDFTVDESNRCYDKDSECVLQLIGAHSIRKNASFAVTLIKALELRGLRVRLDLIGSRHSGSHKLGRALLKRRIKYRLLGTCPNPYEHNATSRVITLVCASTEPYGLTIPESLRYGIPVISSKSGGPSEILPERYLYAPGDLDRCARQVAGVFNAYDEQVREAVALYMRLRDRYTMCDLKGGIDSTLEQLTDRYKASRAPDLLGLIENVRNSTFNLPINVASMADSIARVSTEQEPYTTATRVLESIKCELDDPGRAVRKDIHAYDVVPFAMSANMDDLHKHGIGLAIEISSTVNDEDRLQILTFIVCALHEKQKQMATPLRVLALGDGIGVNAIRLAVAGFSVDYIDYDKSKMSKIAELNVARVKAASPKGLDLCVIDTISREYDAVICLELIEHVPSPLDLSASIYSYLKAEGLLFINDCFNGIDDRWPTRLYANERYSGMLPFMLLKHFRLVGANLNPHCKPFIFAKAAGNDGSGPFDVLLNRFTMIHLLRNQIDVGV